MGTSGFVFPSASGEFGLYQFPSAISSRTPDVQVGFIFPEEMKSLGIEEGDFVTRSNGVFSSPITSINGIPVSNWKKRWKAGQPAWEDLRSETTGFLQLLPNANPMAKLTFLLFPQREGTAILVEGGRASRKSDLMNAILPSLDSNRYIVMDFFLERDDEMPLVGMESNSARSTLPANVELWAWPYSLQKDEAVLVAKVDHAFSVAKRRALSGQNVILLLDSLEVFAKAINSNTKGDGKTLSGGLTRQAISTLRSYLATAKKPVMENGGSFTIIGLYRLNPSDTGTTSLATEVEGVSQGHILMRSEGTSIPCTSFPIDVQKSVTRRAEYVLGEEDAKNLWGLQKTLRGREQQAYLNAVAGERAYSPEQKAAALSRAGTEIEILYRKLLDACSKVDNPQDIWANWTKFLSGDYPPRPVEVKPNEVVAGSVLAQTTIQPKPIPITPVQVKAVSQDDLAAVLGQKGKKREQTRNEQLALPA